MKVGVRACCPTVRIRWNSVVTSSSIQRSNEKYSIDISIKSIFVRVATVVFCREIVKSTELCAEYFNWNLKSALALGMVGTNIFLGSMVPVFQRAFREFINSAISNPNSLDIYIYPLMYLLNVILFIVVVHAVNAVFCKNLRDQLGLEMRNKIFNSCYEISEVSEKFKNSVAEVPEKLYMLQLIVLSTALSKEEIKPEYDLTFLTRRLCQHLINLANARLSTLSLFIGALRSMYLNSEFLKISVLGLTLEVPYLILACFLYVYGCNIASSWADAIFKKNIDEEINTLKDMQSELSRVSSNLLKNDSDDKTSILKINKLLYDINMRSLLPQFGLSFINKLNSDLSMVIGAIVQLLTGGIDVVSIMYTAQNFSYAAVQASWHRMQLETIKGLEVATERIQKILDVIDDLKQKDEFCVISEP